MTMKGYTNSMKMTSSTPQPQALVDIQNLRAIHQQARENLNAKQTELRLVVASRYKELVTTSQSQGGDSQGTYGELCAMHAHAKELVEMIEDRERVEGDRGIEQLLKDTILPSSFSSRISAEMDGKRQEQISFKNEISLARYRYELSSVPRRVHLSLSSSNSAPMIAAQNLLRGFQLIDWQNSLYPSDSLLRFPIAREYALRFFTNNQVMLPKDNAGDKNIDYQVSVIYEHLVHLPKRVLTAAKEALLKESDKTVDYTGALVAHVLMDKTIPIVGDSSNYQLSCRLLEMFLKHKADMLMKYLELSNDGNKAEDQEKYLSTMVSIIQNLILQAYYIFVDTENGNSCSLKKMLSPYSIVQYSLCPLVLKEKVSQFLKSYLPLVEKTARSILSNMKSDAGLLGSIREKLYQAFSNMEVNSDWICACESLIDVTLLNNQKLDLWGTLFRSSFDQLVHSLLEFSYNNLDKKVSNAIERACSSVPSYKEVQTQDIYTNVTNIVIYLQALLANLMHESGNLVHLECAEESSISLKESLYVQTCTLIATLVGKMRRMSETVCHSKEQLATLHLFISRLARSLILQIGESENNPLTNLLEFDEKSALSSSITIDDLKTSFEICDVEDSGFLNTDVVIECLQSVFTGNNDELRKEIISCIMVSDHDTFSFEEVALFCARGLSHTYKSNPFSARDVIKSSLFNLFETNMTSWAETVVSAHEVMLSKNVMNDFNKNTSDSRHNKRGDVYIPDKVSSYIMGYFVGLSSDLIRSVCPADMQPVGFVSNTISSINIISYMHKLILRKSHEAITATIESAMLQIVEGDAFSNDDLEVPLIQLWCDLKFSISSYDQVRSHMTGERIKVLESKLMRIESQIDPISMEIVSSALSESGILSRSSVSCSLFMNTLFQSSSLYSSLNTSSLAINSSLTEPIVSSSLVPVSSTRRFLLLPVQEERQDILLSSPKSRQDIADTKLESRTISNSSSNPLSKSSFGFFSSMLGK